jgi:FkbM family methyltransferase
MSLPRKPKSTRKRGKTTNKTSPPRKRTGPAFKHSQLSTVTPVIEAREETSLATVNLDMDCDLWGRAKTQWLLADWDSLAAMDPATLANEPRRAELATLSACANLQMGKKNSARLCFAAASRWKCPPQFTVRALVASSEASMAKYHALCGHEKAASLLASSVGAFGGDGALAAKTILNLKSSEASGDSLSTCSQSLEDSLSCATTVTPSSNPISLDNAIDIARSSQHLSYRDGITSHAQNFEDVMLWRALREVSPGCYIDIGAADPTQDSVSFAFHQMGWRGVHVEPCADYARALRAQRPNDMVIEAVVSDTHGGVNFQEISQTGLSTGLASVADFMETQGFAGISKLKPSLTLDDVIAAASFSDIHWLKIDVEGMEEHVLKGWRSNDPLPWILVVESTLPRSTVETHSLWEHYVRAKGYKFAYFDGLSRFYVSPFHVELLPAFSVPPNTFDSFSRA